MLYFKNTSSYVVKHEIEKEHNWVELPVNTPTGIHYSQDELINLLYGSLGEEVIDEGKYPIPYKIFDNVKVFEGNISLAVYKLLPGKSPLVDDSPPKGQKAYLILEVSPYSFKEWCEINVKPISEDVVNHGCSSGIVSELLYTWDILNVLQKYPDEIVEVMYDYLEGTGTEITLKAQDFDSFGSLMTKLVWTSVEIVAADYELDDDDDEDDDDDDGFYEDDYDDDGFYEDDLEALKYEVLDPDTDLFN